MKRNFKYDRLAEDIKLLINDVVNDEIDDLEFVTVVDVELTKDLGDAKVFVQCLNSEDEEEVLYTLNRAKGYIKKRLAEEVKMRRIPNLIFRYDHSLDNYNNIDNLLKDM